jgi:hypothetical protein
MRLDGHRYAVGTNCGTIDPIDLVFDTGIVYQIAGRKIVGAIQDYVAVFEKTFNV